MGLEMKKKLYIYIYTKKQYIYTHSIYTHTLRHSEYRFTQNHVYVLDRVKWQVKCGFFNLVTVNDSCTDVWMVKTVSTILLMN